jgi:hypothetical protein
MSNNDEFDKLFHEYKDLKSEIDHQRHAPELRSVEETHSGILNDSIEKLGEKFDPEKRKLIIKGLLLIASGAAGVITTSAATTTIIDSLTKSQEDWMVREGVASFISEKLYNDPWFDTAYADSREYNQGEIALIRSYVWHRKGELALLESNTALLRKAFNESSSPSARTILAGRLAIDFNRLGKGQEAVSALQLLNLNRGVHPSAIRSALDYETSITLNTMSFSDFERLGSFDRTKIIESWRLLGIDHELDNTPRDFLEIAKKNAFAPLMWKHLLALGKNSQKNDGRDYWLKDIEDCIILRAKENDASEFFEDGLYSLCRPTFHAYACGDIDQTIKFLDIYLGRTEWKVGRDFQNLHKQILERRNPNTLWMLLLDARVKSQVGKSNDAEMSFASACGLLGKTKNIAIEKAFGFVSREAKFALPESRDHMAGIVGMEKIPPLEMHQAYLEAVSRQWEQ